MVSEQYEQKLVAILYADVAGYSRLTGEDEVGTHRALSTCLDLFAEAIDQYGGQVVHYAGDAILAEFTTVSNALACAVNVQQDLEEQNKELPDERQVRFRVGVNLGEVIVDRGDIYGDGVNVAARLESLAEPGGVCVSEAVRTALGTKLPLEYEYLGEQEVKNITEPVRAYHARLKPGAVLPPPTAAPKPRRAARLYFATALAIALIAGFVVFAWLEPWKSREEPASVERMAFPLPDKLSIAVLPFANMSDDPEQEYFADGITDDLITDLSRVSGLLVIARNSTFQYKGKSPDVRDVARDLGVGYVLEGSIRKAGDRVRINAQLIDANTGHHHWADRFDKKIEDVFALQDEVTRRIVKALAVKLTTDEEQRFVTVEMTTPEAYDMVLRGLERYRRFTPEANLEARTFFEKAIELDPRYARAHADLALTYTFEAAFAFSEHPEATLAKALENARTATALDPTLPQAHYALSLTLRWSGRAVEALDAARRTLELDPNYADGYPLLAHALIATGKAVEAIDEMGEGMRRNPLQPALYLWTLGRAYFFAGRYEDAAAELERAIEANPQYARARVTLAATYAMMDRQSDAEWQAEEVLALLPDFTIERARQRTDLGDPGYLKRHLEALRNAGVPE